MRLSRAELTKGLRELAAPVLATYGERTARQWVRLMDTTNAEREMMGDDGLTLAKLRALGFPILAVYGDHSPARLTGAELVDVWPHADFRRVRDAGHFFPISRAHEVIVECERFWNGEFGKGRRNRDGEAHAPHFRSDRIYQTGGRWYCQTRESARVGPFAAKDEVEAYLASYIEAMALDAARA
jgi:hypothetical protein